MANFLQLTPENIAQAKNMSWGQAISQDFNPRNPNYRGFSTAYQGADRTGLGKYVTGGLKSLAGIFEPGSNVGGATPLTRKLALGIMENAPKLLSRAALPLELLRATPANADEVEWEKQLMASIPTQEDRVKAGIQRQMINEGTATPMARRTYGNMSMGQGRPNWVADRSPVQQGLKSIDIGMAPPTYTIDPNMMHAAKMQRMNRGNMNNYPMINRITDKLSTGLGALRDTVTDTATGFYDTIGGGIKNIMDNTIIGKIAAMNDATNPRAWNYNPRLQEQIDYLKGTGQYGVMDQSGLNKITGGVLAGKNLQSMFGSNDLATMYEKELERATDVLENLPNQWSNLKETDPEKYDKKFAWHQNKVNQIKAEKAAAAAAAKAAADKRIAAERNFVTQGLGVTAADAATSGRGMDHTRGMTSRERGMAASRMGGGSRQAKSGSQKAGGSGRTDSGWGWSQGGIVSLWRR